MDWCKKFQLRFDSKNKVLNLIIHFLTLVVPQYIGIQPINE
jgi:hypothetical protein